MHQFIRGLFLLLLSSLSLSAIANPCDDGGIGGTGIAMDHGMGGTGITDLLSGVGGTGLSTSQQGIGGTGLTPRKEGIGGTGAQARSGVGGTGIVGMITGFGSICVNGLEVHYYNNTHVDLDGSQISSQALAIGQIVAVKANGTEQSLVAEEIHAYHQITGPITSIMPESSQISVMGQLVFVKANMLEGLKLGQWIHVSGLRNDEGIVTATRIDTAIVQKNAQILGRLVRRDNKVYLGETVIEGLPKTMALKDLDTQLTGIWEGNHFKAKVMTSGPVSLLLQKVTDFNFQGITASELSAKHLKIAGQSFILNGQTRIIGINKLNQQASKTVIVKGILKDGKPTVQSIEVQSGKSEGKKQESPTKAVSFKSGNVSTEKATSAKENNEMNGSSHDKVETVNKIQNFDHIDKVDKIDKVEKVERPDRPERPDIPEKPDRPDKPDRPETPEKPG